MNYKKTRSKLQELSETNRGLRNNYAELTPDSTTGLQVITGRENGRNFKIEVPPEDARFLQGLGEEELNSVLKGVRALSQPIRAGLTGVFNPPFAVLNAGFNAIMSPVLSPQGFRVFGPKAVAESFKSLNSNSALQKTLRERGAQRFTGTLQTTKNTTTADALAAEASKLDKVKYNVKNPAVAWRSLDVIGAKLDVMARTAVAEAARSARLRKGGTAAQAADDAAYAFNNVLPNFGRMSSLVKQVDSGLMYAGASQAGTRALLTGLKRDPVGVAARLALVTSGMAGATAYTFAQDNGKAFHEDMRKQKKDYLLDNNIIIVTPGAKKNNETGEWSGVIKIPLAPELRSINKAANEAFLSNAKKSGAPLKDYALAFGDFVTGGARTLSNPVANLATGIVTNVDPRTGREIVSEDLKDLPKPEQAYQSTSGTAKTIGNVTGQSPAKIDYVLRGFGLPGQAAQKGNPITATAENFKNRFVGAKGLSTGAEFYQTVDNVVKEAGLNKNEKDAFFGTVLPSKKDAAGNKLNDKTYYDSASKATTWLRYPKTFEASKKINDAQAKKGNPSDPLFSLSPQQRKIVLNLQANYSPGNKEEKAIQTLNPWIKDFNKQRSAYYDQIKSKLNPEQQKALGVDPMGITVPTATPEIQKKLNDSQTLTGAAKRDFYANNPDVSEYLAQQTEYQRVKRDFLGLPQFDRYPTASKEVQKLMDTYNKLPKGNGPAKRDGTPSSPDRSAWIKANPVAWATISAQYDKIAAWNAAEEGSQAVYEGINAEGNAEGTPLKGGGAGSGSGYDSSGFNNADGTSKASPTFNLSNFVAALPDNPISTPKAVKVRAVKSRTPKGTPAKRVNIASLALPNTKPTFKVNNTRVR